jgi:23S rRNA (guanosine2251-2'-O)-methyltransferase
MRLHERLVIAEGVKWDARMRAIRGTAERLGIDVEVTPRGKLDALAPGIHHQGIVLVTSPYPYAELDAVGSGAPIVLLDHLQDPHNAGAILRTAEVFGLTSAILPVDRSVSVTPAVVSASAGAVEYMAISQVTNLGRTIDMLKRGGYWVVGLDRRPDATPLDQLTAPDPFALIVGAEGSGMSALIAERCDFIAEIPQFGRTESLNASVAAGIALHHLTRRS